MIPFPVTFWGGPPIETISSDTGNVLTGATGARTFSGISVGASEVRKKLIVALTMGSSTGSVTISSVVIDPAGDNIAMTAQASISEGGGGTHIAAIYTADISVVSGTTVSVVVTPSTATCTWGISTVSVRNMRSETPVDTGTNTEAASTTITTSSTVAAQSGGFAIGSWVNDRRSAIVTSWDNLTEKTDLQTGTGTADHRHSIAWDLLPTGRAAATETVTDDDGTQGTALAVAAFR